MARFSHLLLLAGLFLISACAPKSHPEEPNVKAFLNRYFETWSNQDMENYGNCFHSQARVFFITESGGVISQGLTDFLHGQRMSHQQATEPMKEVPLEMRIQMDDKAAQAHVTWSLMKGKTEERGTDLFTLKRDGQGWKIVNLTFYEDEMPKDEK